MGDLNYRIEAEDGAVREMYEKGEWGEILDKDQVGLHDR
jgi:hypothetical protein